LAGASSAGTVTCASSLLKEVYNPKAVIPHAASLHQASAHCAIFPTAASRRSLGRVSVPVWPVALSGRLPVVALVGHHPTNKLIGREPIPDRKTFHTPPCDSVSYPVLAPVSEGYPKVQGRLLTCYSPVRRSSTPKGLSARLACVKHAASVRPEPGSNSPTKTCRKIIPATKKLAAKGKPRPTIKRRPAKDQTNWHWLIKHPVEFSKNNHTPKTNRLTRRPALGALVQLYPRYFSASNPGFPGFAKRISRRFPDPSHRSRAAHDPTRCDFLEVWQDGR
jgi:hypothetical protein